VLRPRRKLFLLIYESWYRTKGLQMKLQSIIKVPSNVHKHIYMNVIHSLESSWFCFQCLYLGLHLLNFRLLHCLSLYLQPEVSQTYGNVLVFRAAIYTYTWVLLIPFWPFHWLLQLLKLQDWSLPMDLLGLS